MVSRLPFLVALPLLAASTPDALPDVDTAIATGASNPQDFAVVVGIEDYGFLPDVAFARRDAEAVADALVRTRGLPDARVVRLIGQPSREQITDALGEAGRTVGEGGLVWVYFAGHGAANPSTGERMLLPVETPRDLQGFSARGIGLSEVEQLATVGGAQALVVTDVCFTGAGRDGAALLPDRRLAVPTSAVPPSRGATWLATGADEAAGPLASARHGAFTWAVLGALRGWADGAVDDVRDGTITSDEAQAYVRSALRHLGIEDQTPSWTGPALTLVTGKGKLENAPSLPRVVADTAVVAAPPPSAPLVEAGAWSARKGVLAVRMPAGTFTMGSPPTEPGRAPSEGPVSTTLTRDVLVMRSEVTQALYRAVTHAHPSRFRRCGPTCPVEQVSWADAAAFANALSVKDGLQPAYTLVGDVVTWSRGASGWRLPTEAEWERAARAGTTAVYAGGDDPRALAWFADDAQRSTHPVCTKTPNHWNLCDLSGNVAEWTWDGFADALPGGVDPSGPEHGSLRAVRGGAWLHAPMFVRVAQRYGAPASTRSESVGFRLVRWAP